MVRILIVEDDTEINNVLKESLMASGYECQQAFSGTEALIYIEHEVFSIIILDLMLPGLAGEEVLKEARKKVKTPIIVLSSKAELDTKVDLLTLGADDYMTKPFEIKELLVRVMVQLRKESNQSIPIYNTLKYNVASPFAISLDVIVSFVYSSDFRSEIKDVCRFLSK